MGTDIHTYIEKKNKETGKWEYSPLYRKLPNNTYEVISPFPGRSYPMFGILSEVRYMFGYSYSPIDEPRGLPTDVSPEVKAENDDDYYHTHSYYILSELRNYYNTHHIPLTKNHPLPTMLLTNQDGEPIPINGQNAYITPYHLIEEDSEDEDFQYGLNALKEIIDYMQVVMETDFNLNPEDVRLVFWYDS